MYRLLRFPIERLARRFGASARERAQAGTAKTATGASSDDKPLSRHAIGAAHTIHIPAPGVASDYLLILRVESSIPSCWLAVDVNGVRQRSEMLRLRSVLCYRLAWSLLAGASDIAVTLDTGESGDAVAGGLLSVFDVWLKPFTPPIPVSRPHPDSAPLLPAPASEAELLSRFVSFGDNCEFGLYQRRHGADATSFLRLAAVQFEGLMLGLEEHFAACADPGELFFQILQYADGRREYVRKNRRYQIYWHTLVEEAQVSGVEMVMREYEKLGALRRKLLESLAAGNRIIVFKTNEGLSAEDRERLALALAPYGRNGLLVVAPARRKDEIGRVILTESGVMIGYIDRFLPYDAANVGASNAWMTICRNAFECWRRHGTQKLA